MPKLLIVHILLIISEKFWIFLTKIRTYWLFKMRERSWFLSKDQSVEQQQMVSCTWTQIFHLSVENVFPCTQIEQIWFHVDFTNCYCYWAGSRSVSTECPVSRKDKMRQKVAGCSQKKAWNSVCQDTRTPILSQDCLKSCKIAVKSYNPTARTTFEDAVEKI